MDYGNTGGAEFNWNYSMGGNGGGGGASSIYPQVSENLCRNESIVDNLI